MFKKRPPIPRGAALNKGALWLTRSKSELKSREKRLDSFSSIKRCLQVISIIAPEVKVYQTLQNLRIAWPEGTDFLRLNWRNGYRPVILRVNGWEEPLGMGVTLRYTSFQEKCLDL